MQTANVHQIAIQWEQSTVISLSENTNRTNDISTIYIRTVVQNAEQQQNSHKNATKDREREINLGKEEKKTLKEHVRVI